MKENRHCSWFSGLNQTKSRGPLGFTVALLHGCKQNRLWASFFHLPEGAMAAGKRAHRPRGQRRRCYPPWRARHRTISCACERCPGGRACLAATSCDGLLEWSRRAASAQGAGTGRDCARGETGSFAPGSAMHTKCRCAQLLESAWRAHEYFCVCVSASALCAS